MTVRRMIAINCDGCGDDSGADLSFETANELRDVLRRDGWRVNLPGGRDLCETCRATPPGGEQP